MKGPSYQITIDMGTTHTRLLLLDENRQVLARFCAEAGVRNTALDGHKGRITAAVRDGIAQLLQCAGLSLSEIGYILASGMITSNAGLVEIPHLPAPVGPEDLARAVVAVTLPEICGKPIHFIPGVKNALAKVDLDHFPQMDMMRGEEVECLGLLADYPTGRPYLVLLPGSHTKFVRIDAAGRIAGCMTTLSGELLDAVTRHTLIADAVCGQFVAAETYDRAMVLRGFDLARKSGFSRAAFSARILSQFKAATAQQIANFLLGAVLAEDAAALRVLDEGETRLLVTGKAPLQQALMDVLEQEGWAGRAVAAAAGPLPLSARGALLIGQLLAQRD